MQSSNCTKLSQAPKYQIKSLIDNQLSAAMAKDLKNKLPALLNVTPGTVYEWNRIKAMDAKSIPSDKLLILSRLLSEAIGETIEMDDLYHPKALEYLKSTGLDQYTGPKSFQSLIHKMKLTR